MISLLRSLFSSSEPRSRLWEKCDPTLFPPKMTNGKRAWGEGQLWRRWNGSQWEYQRDPEMADDWASRQV